MNRSEPRPNRSCAARVLACVLAVGLALPATAFAQDQGEDQGASPSSGAASWTPPAFPAYPRSPTFSAIRLWLLGDTDVGLGKVVLLNTEAVYAFDDPDVTAPSGGVVSRVVRQEVISADLAKRMGARSAAVRMDFDCAHAETTVNTVTLYPGNNLGGGDGQTETAARWMAANPGVDLTELSAAACEADYRRPFAASLRTAGDRHAPSPAAHSAGARAVALRGPAEPTSAAAEPAGDSAPPPSPLLAPAPHPHTGTIWVQVGAFASDVLAQSRWDAIKAKAPADTEGLSLRDEPVAHGAGTLWRALVGPFADRHEAAGFCMRLRAQGVDCLIR